MSTSSSQIRVLGVDDPSPVRDETTEVEGAVYELDKSRLPAQYETEVKS